MQTTIKQVSPVDYELDITATAEDLAPDFKKALQAQRARTHLKGFRPGKVPLPLLKKMYGEAIGYTIADKLVQEVYEDLVLHAGEHDVLGQPTITELHYHIDGDLHAVIQFGVRPDIVLQDLAGEAVDTLVHEVTDEEVEEEIDRMLEGHADLAPVEDEPIAETDLVVYDLQELDAATRTPLIGKRDADQTISLDDPDVDGHPLLGALRQALLGAQAGQKVHFRFEHDKAHDGLVESIEHAHFFEATIKEVKRPDVPELDDEFVKEITQERLDDVAAFRDEVRNHIEESWAKRAREFLEGNIVARMLELHPAPVPESVVDLYVDSYVEDIKRRNKGTLPDSFPVEAFKQANRGEAEEQARWMLVRDAFIDAEELDVVDDDVARFFEQEAEKDENFTPANLRQFYESMGLIESLEQRLLNQKIFDLLAERFEVVEKDIETLEREQEERRAEARARAEEAEAAAARAREEAEARAREEAEAAAEVETLREEEAETPLEADVEVFQPAGVAVEAGAEAAVEPNVEANLEPEATAEVEAQVEEWVEESVVEKTSSKKGFLRFLWKKKE